MLIFDYPNEISTWLLWYPAFNIARIFYIFLSRCSYDTCISDVSNIPSELVTCLIILYVSSVIYTFLGIYLYEVIPQQFGIRRSPLFFLDFLCKKKRKGNAYSELKDEKDATIVDEEILKEIEQIRELIQQNENLPDNDNLLAKYPLICQGLSKEYENATPSDEEKLKRKRALNNFNIILKENEIFGLLGPNGAGKSTFFSLLTGIYSPTEGNAWVGGQSILKNIAQIQENIGYCPQFDILWGDLTVEEHLYFYCRLKNVSGDKIKVLIHDTLKSTLLLPYKKFKVSELSGGMKRRLSLGISVVGEPKVVFLDEPTTGLDPENKRQIWDILSNCKEGKSIILTTHIMEEAELLTDRIGIIINGELRCLGTKYKLKKNYGKGFKLTLHLEVSLDQEALSSLNVSILGEESLVINKITKFITESFEGSELHEFYKDSAIFIIPNESFNAEYLFNTLTENKKNIGIINWSISQVNLEDIFIKLTENEIYT